MAEGAAESGTNIPGPALDLPRTPDGKLQTAVLAGGCFWGVQAVFQHVKGVEPAVSGYSGGDQAALKRLFPESYGAEPKLVTAQRPQLMA